MPPTKPKRQLDNSFGVLVRAISTVMYADISSKLSALDITPELSVVLFAIGSESANTPQTLTRMLLVDRATIARRLRTLESKGLITRKLDPADRRSHLIKLTRSGQALFRKADTLAQEVNTSALQDLSAQEQQALLDTLRQVLIRTMGQRTTVPQADS